MRILFIIFLFITSLSFSQDVDTTANPLHGINNIKKFADYLFCQKDYLRAADEYLKIINKYNNDEINYKIAISFSTVGKYSEAQNYFSAVKLNSIYFENSKLELLKILFLDKRYSELRNRVSQNIQNVNNSPESKLSFLTSLADDITLPSYDNFIVPFDNSFRNEVSTLYNMKFDQPQKNPAVSAVLSAIIPGAGKFYTGEITDGFFALLTTGLFAFLAYDNFKAKHEFRGWLFSGLAAGFYGGNVYGSIASAQIYNARLKYEFNIQLDSFLKSVNYFIPEYDLCK